MKNQLAMAILSMVFIASCSLLGNDDDENDDNGGNGGITSGDCRLNSFNVGSSYSDGTYSGSYEESFTFSYENDVLTGVLSTYADEWCEGTNCESESGTREIKPVFTGGTLTGFDLYVDGELLTDFGPELEFDNGLLVLERYDFEGEIDEYRYSYNTSGQLISEENWDNYSGLNFGEMVLYSRSDFTYSGGNLVNRVDQYNDFSSGRKGERLKKMGKFMSYKQDQARQEGLVTDYQAAYTYDDKKNLFGGLGDVIFYIIEAPEWSFSQNNVVGSTESYGDDPEEYSSTNTLQYNSNDYPISIEMIDDDGEVTQITVDYDCN